MARGKTERSEPECPWRDILATADRRMQRVVRNLQRAARESCPGVLSGETGTGKELAARAIHGLGPRRAEPFVPVHCGSAEVDLRTHVAW